MSRPDTGRVQLERLASAGLRVALTARLADVDTFGTARQVAGQIPCSRFAAVFAAAAGAPAAAGAAAAGAAAAGAAALR